MPKRFGVMFSGGTSASMHAIAEYLARHCTIQGAELFGFKQGWLGLIRSEYVPLTIESTRGIGLRPGGALLGSCTKVNVFNHEGHDYSQICCETYRALRLDAIFVLGGDGSNRQANELSQKFKEMRFVWISATLDNDVVGCTYTNGFDSAVRNAAAKIACMANDGQTMGRHTITECMGRHSGHVTIHAVDLALRQHPDIKVDIILVPEIPIDIKAICNRMSQTQRPLNIVISEGITWTNETKKEEAIAGHHKSLADTSKKLSAILQKYTRLQIRTETIGYCQRTGPVSTADCFLAENSAKLAVQTAFSCDKSMSVVFNDGAFKAIPMEELVHMNENADAVKQKTFLADPVVYILRDQLNAGALHPVL